MTVSTGPAFDLTAWLTPDASDALSRAMRRRSFAAGAIVYTQGDAGDEMFRVVSGSVRLSVRRHDGREIVFLLLRAGDFFGDSSMVDGGPRPQSAEALTAVELDVLSRAAFDELHRADRAYDLALLKLLSTQMRVVSERFAEASLSSLRARVARRILELAPLLRGGGGDVRLSQTEMAAMVGASRQSVNKVLGTMQREGILEIEHGSVGVLDLAAVRREAADD
ncbi:MAG: Crp/Fnr family transcriptional regulator [Sphingomonas adhaesiva]|uniref:Crp/Fnr family transcriptional regulator n=1 Tax=Sphingomonas adhaesiva TaxID=28212 RepID=UPI002FFBF08E